MELPVSRRFALHISPTRAQMGRMAAADVAAAIRALLLRKARISMVFAAAPSQQEFLTALVQDEGIDFARIDAFHMDEYLGLAPDAPQGFGNFLRERLFSRAPFGQVHYMDGGAADPAAECARYAALLRESPPDIVCLGIGENGHLAFNDPHVARLDDEAAVKVVALDEQCRRQQVNDGCFAALELVPQQAITLTMPALLRAGRHFCMVPGPTKARAAFEAVAGAIDMRCPASALRLARDARLYLDAQSAAHLLPLMRAASTKEGE